MFKIFVSAHNPPWLELLRPELTDGRKIHPNTPPDIVRNPHLYKIKPPLDTIALEWNYPSRRLWAADGIVIAWDCGHMPHYIVLLEGSWQRGNDMGRRLRLDFYCVVRYNDRSGIQFSRIWLMSHINHHCAVVSTHILCFVRVTVRISAGDRLSWPKFLVGYHSPYSNRTDWRLKICDFFPHPFRFVVQIHLFFSILIVRLEQRRWINKLRTSQYDIWREHGCGERGFDFDP
jgi:hypothetical protein